MHHAGGATTVTVDQRTRVGEWVSLGSYAFTEGSSHKVVLANAANGTVVADSVRLVRDNSGDTDTEQKTFAYAYDADGNLTSLTDSGSGARVDTYAMAYDGLNRLAKVEEKLAGAVRGTTAFTYDPIGNPLTRAHDRQNATFEYDPRDRIAKLTRSAAGGGIQETETYVRDATYNYDPLGRLDTVTSDGKVLEKYAYDPYDRTTSRTEKVGGSGEETTVFSFLGLSDEVAAEEIDGVLKKT